MAPGHTPPCRFNEIYYLRGEADENNVHHPLAKQHMAVILKV